MQLGHNATVLSSKDESEGGEDSKSDEYESEEEQEWRKYANLLVPCTGVWKMKSCCCTTEQGTIFLFVMQKYVFVKKQLIFLMWWFDVCSTPVDVSNFFEV